MFPGNDTVDVWYRLLQDLDYKDAADALGKHLSTSVYPPTIADIRMNIQQEELNGEAAWNLVYKAVGNSIYFAEDEFNNLPDLIKKVIISPGHLREMALMPTDTVNSVEKSHFLRIYETEKKKAKEVNAMPEEIRQRLAGKLEYLEG